MKKALSVILVMLMAISMLTVSAFAFEKDEDTVQVPTTNEEIVIDGVKDAVYNQGLKVTADLVFTSQTDVADYADYYYLWKPEGLYVFIECHDRDVHDSNATVAASGCAIWETDHACVDIRWDEYDNSTYYQYSMTTSSVMRLWTNEGALGEQPYATDEDQQNLLTFMEGKVDLTPDYGYNVELLLKAEVILEEQLSTGAIACIQAEFISVDSSFCVDSENDPDNFGNARYVTLSGEEDVVDSLGGNTHQADYFVRYQMSNKIVDANGEVGTTEPEETKAPPQTGAPQDETKAPETKAPETNAADTAKTTTDETGSAPADQNNNTVLWIVIAVVAVVVVAVIVVVAVKKKKK